jgi:hypothetical protein
MMPSHVQEQQLDHAEDLCQRCFGIKRNSHVRIAVGSIETDKENKKIM